MRRNFPGNPSNSRRTAAGPDGQTTTQPQGATAPNAPSALRGWGLFESVVPLFEVLMSTVRLVDTEDAQRDRWNRVLAAALLIAVWAPFFAAVFAPLAGS